jgi:hypothetical protein
LPAQKNKSIEHSHEAQLGMELRDQGDEELMLWFDPSDADQVRFALQTIGAYRRRSVTVTQEMRERLARARQARGMPVFA